MNKNLLYLTSFGVVAFAVLYAARSGAESKASKAATIVQQPGDAFPELELPEIGTSVYNIAANPINSIITPALNFITNQGPITKTGDILLQMTGAQPRDLTQLLITPDGAPNSSCNVCAPPVDYGPEITTPQQQARDLYQQSDGVFRAEGEWYAYVVADGKNTQTGIGLTNAREIRYL